VGRAADGRLMRSELYTSLRDSSPRASAFGR